MQYGIILSRDQPMSGLLSAQNSMKSADKYGRDRYHPPAADYALHRNERPLPRKNHRYSALPECLTSNVRFGVHRRHSISAR